VVREHTGAAKRRSLAAFCSCFITSPRYTSTDFCKNSTCPRPGARESARARAGREGERSPCGRELCCQSSCRLAKRVGTHMHACLFILDLGLARSIYVPNTPRPHGRMCTHMLASTRQLFAHHEQMGHARIGSLNDSSRACHRQAYALSPPGRSRLAPTPGARPASNRGSVFALCGAS